MNEFHWRATVNVTVSSLALGVAIGLAPASQVLAQTAPVTTPATAQEQSGQASTQVQEVVVTSTASRVQRKGFVAPTPTSVQTVEMLKQQGLNNVADLLNEDPAMHGSIGPQSSTFGFNSTGNNFVNLRNLGSGTGGSKGTAARTLVLVDGERVVFDAIGGGVDLNMIPTIMLDHTEIVTGGASAGYGSDAVAGVVNLVLKKNFNGLQAEASGGVSTYGDDKTSHLAFLYGGDVGPGHLMIGAQYDDEAGVGPSPHNPRAWANADCGPSGSAAATVVGAGNVHYLVCNLQDAQQSYGGLINTVSTNGTTFAKGALTGTAFEPNGTPYSFVYGNQFGNLNASTMQGGSNQYDFNNDSTDLVNPVQRFASVGRYSFEIGSHIDGSITANVDYNDSDHPSVIPRDPIGPVTFTIQNTNPFIPATVLANMNANGITAFRMGRSDADLGAYEAVNSNQVYQIAGDLAGDFSAFNSDWNWDAHAGYGSNYLSSALNNDRLDANFNNAINVIAGPGGTPECASATARAAGCLPFNPFGQYQNDPFVKAYFTGSSILNQHTSRTDFNANLHGTPVSTWAGPVSVAMGAEYRIDSISTTSNLLSQQGAFDVDNNKAFSGSTNVGEVYAEAVIPLLSKVTLAKSLDFDGAVREAAYNLSGDTTSWKYGLVWDVNGDLRFRASSSRDSRAPNVSELFTAQAIGSSAVTVIPPGSSTAQTQQAETITQGNLGLKPELADTYSYGVGYAPSWLEGFRVSADYYNITIKNAISITSAQTIITNCQSGQTSYCPALSFSSTGQAIVDIEPLNINAIETSGWDFEVDYSVPMSSLPIEVPGALRLSWLGNYTQHLITVQNGVAIDRAGEVGGGILSNGPDTPHWVWDGNANYAVGPVAFNFHVHYLGSGVLDVTALPGHSNAGLLSMNSVPSMTTFDVGVEYNLSQNVTGHAIQLFGNIKNLTNQAPPFWGQDNSADLIGRFFTLGVRLKL